MLSRELFNIIPVRDKSKLPLIAWGEFKDRKYDGNISTVNYAVICGKVSSCVVIDIDSPELTPEMKEAIIRLFTSELMETDIETEEMLYLEHQYD